MTRVFVCDDAEWFCTLVEAWFEECEDLELVGCAHERESALRDLARARPDVVVLDTMTHGMEPVQVDDVRAAAPGARVVIASGYQTGYAATLLPGADRYVSKDDGQAPLLAAIREQ